MEQRRATVSGMEDSSLQQRTPAKSAARALDILDVLCSHPDGLSFTTLLQILQFPKSSLHELLSILCARGYVDLDPDSRNYTPGIRVWENGQAYLQHRNLVCESRPVMESIVHALNETVQLAVLDGVENVYLAKVDCSHPLRLASEVGKRLPAHATGLGKVLLANLPDEELVARLRQHTLATFTPHTIADKALLLKELAAIRERGFAIDNEEYHLGLRCVAVPIRDSHDRDTAALSASIPIMRADADQLSLALRLLAKGSLDIARRMGCPADDARLRRLLKHPVRIVLARRRRNPERINGKRVSATARSWSDGRRLIATKRITVGRGTRPS